MPVEATGMRIDRFLAERLDLPRNQIQRWVEEQRVALAGSIAKASAIVRGGDEVAWSRPCAVSAGLEPEPGELHVLFEDNWLIALDKPPGLAVHPGAGRSSGTLAHRLLEHYPELAGVGGPGRPGIVHRLDLGTSGLLLVARTSDSYRSLVRLFAGRRIEKRYLAIVWGAPSPASDRIEAPIGRHPVRRKEMAIVPRGRSAVSVYRTVAIADGIALLDVSIETGRTHQIRVHLRHRGWPLVGDPVYGAERWRSIRETTKREVLRRFDRPALHAWKVSLPHPCGEGRLELTAPPPPDLFDLWERATGCPFPGLEPT